MMKFIKIFVIINMGIYMFIVTKNWYELLKEEFKKDYFVNLTNWLEFEYKNKTIYPKPENVFNALNMTKYSEVSIVIIGQDPYHNPLQAHGLCFSVEKDINLPPSLINIFKEIQNELGCFIPNNGNLTKWAKQGILLLNSVLTVEEGKPNSHKEKGWEKLTQKIVELLNERTEPVIFLLWGANAKSYKNFINENKHYVFCANHPSPLSANRGGWFGNNHFKKSNEILKSLNKLQIDWQIENI